MEKAEKAEQNIEVGPGLYNPVRPTHVTRSAPFSMTDKSGKGPAVDDGTELAARIRAV